MKPEFHKLKAINWNIGGAKYLELKSKDSPRLKANEMPRETFRVRLNSVLHELIDREKPSVVTLQEVVRYHADGDAQSAHNIIDLPDEYDYFPHWLVDTDHHSHQGKWNKVRHDGEWPERAFFAQGNAILIRNTVRRFHVWMLPDVGQEPEPIPGVDPIEVVKLESGLYFGDRNTEARAAQVIHLVLSELSDPDGNATPLAAPLDVFVINLHLTTLMMEREGIPEIDEEAAVIRGRQLDIVLTGIVSRYNRWRAEGYLIRRQHVPPKPGETHRRYPPLWVIAGDLNFTPESLEYLTMLRRGFIDLLPSHRVGTKASGLGKDPTLTVDYMFAGPRFEAIDPRIAELGIPNNHVDVPDRLERRVSDHFPLIVSIPVALPAVPVAVRCGCPE